MVSVPYRKQYRSGRAFFLSQQLVKRGVYILHFGRSHKASADMAPASHQIKIICVRCAPAKSPKNTVSGVINKQHHVRQFKRSASPDTDAWRYPFRHCAFGGADKRNRVVGKIIFFKVNCRNKSAAHSAVTLSPIKPYCTVLMFFKYSAFNIIAHCRVDLRYALLGFGKKSLGKNKSQRRGRVAHFGVCALPVFRLSGKLIAGNA